MSEIPSPILLIGDKHTCKSNIIGAKKKYPDYDWIELSAKELNEDQIRSEASVIDFFAQPKAVVIYDIPNRKAFRDFILRLIKDSSDKLKFVIWDSNNEIKVDNKKGTFNKTWGDFIKEVKKFPNSKVVNNGGDFSEKENNANVQFVQNAFQKCNRQISAKNASLFINLVGRNRGIINSEVQKMAYTAPKELTAEYIEENAYPSSKEAVLYKFSNALDESSSEAIHMMDSFLQMGVNENLMAEIIVKKVRWRLAAIHLFSTGMNWQAIEDKLVEMGRFPSCIWHNPKVITGEKRKIAKDLDKIDSMQNFMVNKLGIPQENFKKSDKKKAGECLPLPFLASLICNFLKNKWVYGNQNATKEQLLDKALNDYLEVVEGLKEIRYNGDSRQDLLNMVIVATNPKVIE